ncbi:V8-like Glu-specific endopeptidase [Filimonas lacunae]|uniref:V8-like Glu-specific endopeptidase n=1 Tax=Filimonas lacunae TaxID=477680 RepID=A0A173MGN9_9BACT|nr:trypsin-like peptidase domain-containing protein [Filimonas lacunae]BAV06755.1 lysyl endopeptidase [Filimonas lacunae]SIT34403.1 V8-like Glu-specific endopeptidase [Filimonas lacunae]
MRLLYALFYFLLLAGTTVAHAAEMPASRQLSLRWPITYLPIANCAVLSPHGPSSQLLSGNDHETACVFANKYTTALTPKNSGTWYTTTKGRIWRLGIQSAGAYSLYLTLQSLHLAPGVKLYVYNNHYKQVQGPFTRETLQGQSILSIAPLAGSRVVIELNIPEHIDSYGSLIVKYVYHDRLNLFGSKHSTPVPPLSCEQNINCENGTYWQTEKRAVCKIITDGALCTGTLVGNTSHSQTPYVLTAQHVIFTQQHAQEAVFIFNYEYRTCTDSTIPTIQSVSGASLVVQAEGADAVLLKLNTIPPTSFHPFYAGWDASNVAPQWPAATLHHPWGKPTQIALTYQSILSSAYNSNDTTTTFWRCAWNIGITQPGSSGAPLFNQQHRLAGTLTGGNATCGQGGNDYFYKIAAIWQNTTGINNALQPWLDAAATGLTAIDGYDPYGFDSTLCGQAWNILPYEKLDSSLLTHPFTRQPYPASTPLAEQYLNPGSIVVSAIYLHIASLFFADSTDYITVTLWQGANAPQREIYAQHIRLYQLHKGINTILPDSLLSIQGNFFVGYDPHVQASSQLNLYRAANRGKNGASTLFIADGSWQPIHQLDANITTAAGIGIQECYGKTHRPVLGTMRVYPNPSHNYLHFTLPGCPSIKKVRCINTTGKEMPVQFQPSEISNTVYFQLPYGVYRLQVFTSDRVYNASFIAGPQ